MVAGPHLVFIRELWSRICISGGITECPDVPSEIPGRSSACGMHIRQYLRGRYYQPNFTINIRMAKTEKVKALLYGGVS